MADAPERISMQTFDNQSDLCFSFPETWKLDGDDSIPDTEAVSVVSPQGGFWCVRLNRNETAHEDVVQQAIAAMRDVYPELEVEPVVEHVAGERLSGVDMHFFCLDLTGTAAVRIWQTVQGNYVIFSQADDAHLPHCKPIFHAITTSLIQSQGDEAAEDSL